LDEIKQDEKSHSLVKMGGTQSAVAHLKPYIFSELEKTNKLEEHKPKINGLFKDSEINNAEEISDIVKMVSKNKTGILGLAHPGRINSEGELYPKKNISHEKAMSLFQQKLKEMGVQASEINYQYTKRFHDNDTKTLNNWVKHAKQTSEDLGFLKTGGTDSHKNSFFTHEENLPEEVVENLLKKD
jgi:hypothetical protein